MSVSRQSPTRRPGRTHGMPSSMVRMHTLVTGELSVECWCRGAVVYVPRAEVMALRTDTWGRPDCHAPDAA